MVEPAIFGPIDAVLGGVIQHVVFVLVLANMGTRLLAYRAHREQAAAGAESLERHRGHELSNGALVLAAFYYLSIHQHSGVVLATLVLGTVIADFFEFEARNVEARQGWALERPKGALFASVLAFLYAFYLSLFFVIEPVWDAVI